MTIPKDHKQICSSYGAPTSGNADGNIGDNVAMSQLTPGDDGASWDPSQSSDLAELPSNLQSVSPPASSPQVASIPGANPQPATPVTGPDYIKPDPTSKSTPESSPLVASVPNTPATTNYITPGPDPQPTSESSAPSAPSTPEPTIPDSPTPHTTDSIPRPTNEWAGAVPYWKPGFQGHKGYWHTEGGLDALSKPENTLIAPAIQDDDFLSLDFFRKAEE
ncbi:uncharacterized protein EURHEDRAFT_384085 [Aspergillus ruber CBS 135680]|uniref:Uncharacterized protein n=1 Tax=Aspergillus ruber (strain CBS 135680) TaxID=1388766 RepID=A0A017SMB9_ASPRC|nr:uncharacterized protein EURHEDRAFT_384085 [Aspergillus ruber CBS 135680]EYE98108.1 hypothetical protein EURHEDRAFT_384085 [Aspergillus ruber CBS 135680]